MSPFSRAGGFPIDGSVIYAPAYGDRNCPSIAFDGVNYLVVWQDFKDRQSFDVYGARFSQSGALLDSAGIAIATGISDELHPSIAFDGENYLVVWQTYNLQSAWDIVGARVNRNGTVLDSVEFVISDAPGGQGQPGIAFDGVNFLVAWVDWRKVGLAADIYGARVSKDGSVLDPNGIEITHSAEDARNPAVVFDGTDYLLVWASRGELIAHIYGIRLNRGGAILAPGKFVISSQESPQQSPAAAFDGKNYLVAWEDARAGWHELAIYCARVSRTGVVLAPGEFALSPGTQHQRRPSVASGDNGYLVLWEDDRSNSADVYGARIDSTGNVLDPAGLPIATGTYAQKQPSVAHGDTNYLVAWDDWSSAGMGMETIKCARVRRNGTVLDPGGIIASTATYGRQSTSSIASDGADYLVVWRDERDYTGRGIIRGARVSGGGAVLDGTGFDIGTASQDQLDPAVTCGGTNYLVTWESRFNDSCYAVCAARVSSSGALLDPTAIIICVLPLWEGSSHPSVSFDGINYLVVWRNGYHGIYGTRVSQAGTVLDTSGIVISTGDVWRPAAAFDGTDHLVVWGERRNGYWDICGARVSGGGVLRDSAGIVICAATGNQWYPIVASDGAEWLVLWEDERRGLNWPRCIYGARVAETGIVRDPAGIRISSGLQDEWFCSAAFDGAAYIVLWQAGQQDTKRWDIRGVRVTPAGQVFDSLEVCTDPGMQVSPAIARGAGDQCLATYTGWCEEIEGRLVNAPRIWGGFLTLPNSVGDDRPGDAKNGAAGLWIHPSVFSGATDIAYHVSDRGRTRCELRIYDSCGKLVRRITRRGTPEGRTRWRGEDDAARAVPAGVYFVHLTSAGSSATAKIVKVE